MSSTSLSSILARWERASLEGRHVSPEELCQGRPELIEPMRSLLEAARPALAASAVTWVPSSHAETLPPQTSPPADSGGPRAGAVPTGYEVIRELGRGGMGVVYEARQRALGRVVALKMILAGGHADGEEQARFLAEAAAIAKVQHPGIVQVYEVGTLGGLPFFSMELCEGGSLADRLRHEPLSPAEAAALVEELARAAQAAHDAGVIHRDLKPANVLLSRSEATDSRSVGGDRQVGNLPSRGAKITDFGLAKHGDGSNTRTGETVGTPAYMPPEQAQGRKDVGPAVDVWALGAILYECLAGRPPFLGATAVETVLSVINDEPVPLRQMLRRLPRDLETVCHKCLQKDPARRYASAADLADDLRRFREGRPIAARPVGRVERFVRWCRRNPVVTAVSAAAVLSLVGGLVGMTALYLRAEDQRKGADKARRDAEYQTARASGERERADRERDLAVGHRKEADEQKKAAQRQSEQTRRQAERARAASKILTGMFESSDPLAMNGLAFGVSHKAGQSLTSRDLLERAVKATQEDTNLDPIVKAIVFNDVGNVYRNLGIYDRAEEMLLRSLELRRRHDAPANDLADSLHAVAWLWQIRGRYDQAIAGFEESLALREKAETPDEAGKLNTLLNLGWLNLELNEPERAERLFAELLRRRAKHFGDGHRETATARVSMAGAYIKLGRHAEAFPLVQRAAADFEKLGIDRNIVNAMTGLQNALVQAQLFGDRAGAIKQIKTSLALTRQVLGEKHPYVLIPLVQLAIVEEAGGRYADAFGHFSEALLLGREVVGLTHPQMLGICESLAAQHRRGGNAERGTPLLKECLDARREQYGDRHPQFADALVALARHERESGMPAKAREYFEQAEPIYAGVTDKHPKRHGACANELGVVLYRQGEYAAAEAAFRRALQAHRRAAGDKQGLDVFYPTTNVLYARSKQNKYDGDYGELAAAAGRVVEGLPEKQRRGPRAEWAALSARKRARDGGHAEAAELLGKHAADAKSGHEHEGIAGAYAECLAALARADVPEAERAKWRERYAEAAVAQLRLWWRENAGARLRWGDEEWRPLRGEPAFEALRKEAAKE